MGGSIEPGSGCGDAMPSGLLVFVSMTDNRHKHEGKKVHGANFQRHANV